MSGSVSVVSSVIGASLSATIGPRLSKEEWLSQVHIRKPIYGHEAYAALGLEIQGEIPGLPDGLGERFAQIEVPAVLLLDAKHSGKELEDASRNGWGFKIDPGAQGLNDLYPKNKDSEWVIVLLENTGDPTTRPNPRHVALALLLDNRATGKLPPADWLLRCRPMGYAVGGSDGSTFGLWEAEAYIP